MIAATANRRVIGRNNTLPWRLSADLQHFKATTMGKPIVMGRKTWDSIGRPLPGRANVVVTRNTEFKAEGVEVVHSLDDALALLSDQRDIMLMGGAQLYQQALPRADVLHLTHIDLDIEGDAFFPEWDDGSWTCTAEETHQQEAIGEQPSFQYRFCRYERVDR
ncbi:dihydrofolate reductase [gamma proteobacterium HTCC5015]|nr:dihydrofolate reductase [gamma proteobacterium HTCC5015]